MLALRDAVLQTYEAMLDQLRLSMVAIWAGGFVVFFGCPVTRTVWLQTMFGDAPEDLTKQFGILETRGILGKNLGHQEDLITSAGNRLAHPFFGASGHVHLSGIDVSHTEIQTFAQSGNQGRTVVALVIPGPLADHRDLTVRAIKPA